jgi:hypothetical protein
MFIAILIITLIAIGHLTLMLNATAKEQAKILSLVSCAFAKRTIKVKHD